MYAEPIARQAGFKPLCDLPAHSRGIVRLLAGGKDFANRAVCMGLIPGAEVMVVQNYGRGPLIVAIQETRLALGRGEANKVLVEAA